MLPRSGIYEIRNIVNEKRYIGSAVDSRARQSQHFSTLAKGQHCNRKLQAAWNKYGAGAFAFTVILHCAKEHLIRWEQIAIDGHAAAVGWKEMYNLAPTAGSQLGYKFTPEAIARMAARPGRQWTAEQRAKVSDALKGRQKSAEHLAHISRSLKARPKKLKPPKPIKPARVPKLPKVKPPRVKYIPSVETRAKISAASKGRECSVETRAKIGAAHRGKVISPEARTKMSVAKKGKTLSAEVRANMSASLRRRGPEWRAKLSAARVGNKNSLGRKHPPDVLAKISAASRAMWAARKTGQ